MGPGSGPNPEGTPTPEPEREVTIRHVFSVETGPAIQRSISPNGKWIAFTNETGFGVVDVENREVRMVSDQLFASRLRFSEEGNMLSAVTWYANIEDDQPTTSNIEFYDLRDLSQGARYTLEDIPGRVLDSNTYDESLTSTLHTGRLFTTYSLTDGSILAQRLDMERYFRFGPWVTQNIVEKTGGNLIAVADVYAIRPNLPNDRWGIRIDDAKSSPWDMPSEIVPSRFVELPFDIRGILKAKYRDFIIGTSPSVVTIAIQGGSMDGRQNDDATTTFTRYGLILHLEPAEVIYYEVSETDHLTTLSPDGRYGLRHMSDKNPPEPERYDGIEIVDLHTGHVVGQHGIGSIHKGQKLFFPDSRTYTVQAGNYLHVFQILDEASEKGADLAPGNPLIGVGLGRSQSKHTPERKNQ